MPDFYELPKTHDQVCICNLTSEDFDPEHAVELQIRCVDNYNEMMIRLSAGRIDLTDGDRNKNKIVSLDICAETAEILIRRLRDVVEQAKHNKPGVYFDSWRLEEAGERPEASEEATSSSR